MNIQTINSMATVFLLNHIGLLVLIILWSLAWKGLALWKASKNNHIAIFVILLVLNTVGIAEIIYLAYLHFKAKKEITTN